MFKSLTQMLSVVFVLLTTQLTAFASDLAVSNKGEPSKIVPPTPTYLHQGPIFIKDIRIIDGLGGEPLENRDILIENGKIKRIAKQGILKAPQDAYIISGQGRTVLPGLIDGHSHILVNPFVGDPAEYSVLEVWRPLMANLYAGVTTVSDLGSRLEPSTDLRDAIKSGKIAGPTLYTVGDYFEEGTERSNFLAIRPLMRMVDYINLLDLHKNRKVTMIKAYVMMPLIRLKQLTAEAHKRNMRVVVDSSAWMGSTAYMRAGVDGFAHVSYIHLLSPEEINESAKQNIWAIGTVAITQQFNATQNRMLKEGNAVLNDPLVANFYTSDELKQMRSEDYIKNMLHEFMEHAGDAYGDDLFKNMEHYSENAIQNILALKKAGVLVGLGTDPLFPGMFHGDALHYEMEVWAKGGIPNLSIIKSATYNNAKILQIEDQVGSIQEGMVADLLIVDGNPAKNIKDTRRIVAVIKNGKIIDRDSLIYSAE